MGRPVSRVSRVLMAGPLASYAGAYERELGRRGYTRLTSVNLLRQMSRLSRWVEANGIAVSELTGERIDQFLASQKAAGRHRASWSRPALVCLLDMLNGLGVLRPVTAARVDSPSGLLLASFERYLLRERALTAGTVRGYVYHARRFLDGLPPGSDLAGVSAAQVTASVLRHASVGSVSAAQNFVAGLRAFLRFCFLDGLVDVDLSQATLSVTGRRRSSLPRGISRTHARALLARCDRRTAIGRRDYAMILVLLRLGLRAGETSRLRLDDLDWRAGELVVRGKGAREDRLPLPADVGAAITGYLKRGRPRSQRRELFLSARAPFTPVASATVRSTVRRACRRAGVAEIGAHRLRHTAACQMITAQVPLVHIAGVLRHDSLQSTALYARLDLDQLRRVAAPWPGGGSR